MAGMTFEISAKFDELLRFKKEIANTKDEIKRLYESGDTGGAKKMEQHLQVLQKEHTKLHESLKPVIHEFQKLDETAKKTADNLAKLSRSDELTEQLRIQKQVIKDLETQYESYLQMCKKLDKEGYATSSAKYKAADKLAKNAKAELEAEKQGLIELEKQYKAEEDAINKLSNTKTTYMTQIRQTKQAMMELAQQGKQNTQEYTALQEKLKELGTAMRLVNKEQKNLTTSGSQLQGIMSGMRGIAGGFTAMQGVVGLFTKDAQKFAEIQTKLQAAMSITIGLQATSEMLHKTSAFRMNTVAKAVQLWDGAQKLLNVQLGLSVGLSKALMVSGIGLLIAGIAAAVIAYKNWNKEIKEANKIQSEVRNNTQSEITRIQALESVLKNANNEYKVRNEALLKLKEIMPSYNAHLDEEGKLINDNTDALAKYITKLKEAETAKIYTERLAKAQIQYNDFLDSLDKGTREIVESRLKGDFSDGLGGSESIRIFYDKAIKYLGEVEKYQEKVQDSTAKSLGNETQFEANTKAFWEKQQQDAKRYLESMKDTAKGSEKWLEQMALYEEATNKLETWNLSGKESEKQSKDDTEKRLAEIKKAFETIEKMQQEMRKKISDSEIAMMQEGDQKKLAQIDAAYEEEIAKIREWRDKIAEENKTAGITDVDLSGLTEIQATQFGIAMLDADRKRIADAEKLVREWQRKEEESFIEMLKTFGDYEDKKLAIKKEYEQKIADAEKDGRRNDVELFTKQMNQAYASLASDELLKSGVMERFFDNIDKLSKKTIKNARKEIEDTIKYIQTKGLEGFVSGDIKPYIDQIIGDPQKALDEIDKLNNLLSKTDDAIKRINKKNIFSNIKESFKELRESAGDSVKEFEVLNDMLSDFGYLSSMFHQIGSAMDEAGMKAGKVVITIGEIVGNVVSMAGAGASVGGGWGALIGAVVGAVSSLIPALQSAGEMSEETRNYYESLIKLTDELIDKQLELVRVSSATSAQIASENAKTLQEYQKSVQEDYLNAWLDSGASLFSHSEMYKLTGRIRQTLEDVFTNFEIPYGFYNNTDLAKFLREQEGKNNFTFGSANFDVEALKKAGIDVVSFIEDTRNAIMSLDRDQIIALKEHAPELWAAFGQEVQDYLNFVVEFEDQIKEIERITRESITGITFDELSSGLDGLVKQFDLAFADIANSFEDYMSKAVMNTLKKQFINKELDEWHKQLEEAISDESISEQEAEALRAKYEEIVRKGNEAYNAAMAAMGIDLSTSDKASDNSLRGAYAKASQESIDLLAGFTGAIRVILEEMLRLSKEKGDNAMIAYFITMNESLIMIRDLQAAGWKEVTVIRELSQQVAENSRQLNILTQGISDSNDAIKLNTGRVASDINEINVKGIKVAV